MRAGLPGVIGLLLVSEAGVPIPIPGDVLMLIVGERAAAGAISVWFAVLLLEVVALVGAALLFAAVRGPGRATLDRLGPRVGLTAERLARATSLIERRGRSALAAGRATPGLRTVTVVAGAGCGLRGAFLGIAAGSTLFVQGHLVLGYLLGPLAREAFERARGPALAVLGALVVAGLVLWLARRGRRSGAQSFAEACCPACMAVGLLAGVDRSARDVP